MSVVQEISRWVQNKPGWFSDAVQSLPDSLEVAFDSGARRILLPVGGGVQDISLISRYLLAKLQTGFFAHAVCKAIGGAAAREERIKTRHSSRSRQANLTDNSGPLIMN